MNSVKKNFIYNLIYQLLLFVFPLITVPYISRVLGTNGVGIYSYTYSIVYYFMLITLLGINNHGNRSIAKVRDNKEELSKTFFGIYSIQLISGLLMIVLYVLYMLLINNNYINIAWIQIIFIISAIFDINWFFFGLEEFKVTITRSTIVKVLSLIFIFLFVKTNNDLIIYTLIMTLSTLLSQLLLLPFLIKKINIVKIGINDIMKHIKPVLVLFIPVIAVSIYRVMDKIMLGAMTNVTEVGLYEQADKIMMVPLTIMSALGTVMLPRISNLITNNKQNQVLDYIKKSIVFNMFISFPMCFGIIAISSIFVPFFLGNGFNGTINILKLISTTIIFASFANILKTQFLIPQERDKDFTISTIIGAIINFIMNVIFIPKYQSIGACFGTIAAELFVLLYQMYAVRKELPICGYIKSIIPYFVTSIIMFVVIYPLSWINIGKIYILLLQIVLGIIIYSLLNINYIINLMKGVGLNVKGKGSSK